MELLAIRLEQHRGGAQLFYKNGAPFPSSFFHKTNWTLTTYHQILNPLAL